MHILFVTDNFPPETNAPASRTFEHARQWVREGHRVTVITCVPNFPKGRVFEGYRNRPWQCEQIEGVDVVRVWSFISANEGFALRVLDFMSFMASAMIAGLFVRRPDIVVATSPQFFTLIAGNWIRFWRRVPWVLELRDIWPESIKAVGAMRQSVVIRLLERIEMGLYRRADRIVIVARSFAGILAARGIDPGKIDVVTNGVDLSRFAPMASDALRARLGWSDRFVVGYIGTHGMAHALETLLGAANLLQADPQAHDVTIAFIGDGARKAALEADARNRGLSNVMFLPSVSKTEVVEHWGALDATVVHLRGTDLFRSVIPSKIFEAMAMGVPILMGVEGEACDIVLNARAGIAFEPESAQGLADAIRALRGDPALRHDMSASAVVAAPRFDRRNLAREFLEIMKGVVRG
ncbi:glycosyltransferase WbuB [Sphingomonas melonis TY]|uniref:Glycosyltransferase WbuB n=2 Tax=Sphingomonas melonis TaxID=152682 RepID=A0A175Y3H0_9SPHN|nr:glycosyltransferase family 4 protein [Sphingomonas melonis]AOW25593.1 glycosyltransferase WbuB [Sphingomonas melonis TY]KZB94999.1 glycosyltransferase WbuB [Sphingomonas melonis TY]